MRQSAATAEDIPGTALDRTAWPVLFGEHPLGAVVDPRNYLEAITVADLLRTHAERFVTSRLIIIIVGDVALPSIRDRIRQRLSSHPTGEPHRSRLASPDPLDSVVRARAKRRTGQPEVLVAYPTRGNEPGDRAPMDFLTHILGGHDERLSTLIRGERGWAYWLRGVDWRYPGAGLFGIRTAVPRAHLEETASLIIEAIARLAERAPTPTEMERARRYLTTARARAWQRSAYRAARLSVDELRGDPPEDLSGYEKRMTSVTPEAIRDLARRIVSWSEPAVVTLR